MQLCTTNIGTIHKNFCILDEKNEVTFGWHFFFCIKENILKWWLFTAENLVFVYFFANVVVLYMIYVLAWLLTSNALTHQWRQFSILFCPLLLFFFLLTWKKISLTCFFPGKLFFAIICVPFKQKNLRNLKIIFIKESNSM